MSRRERVLLPGDLRMLWGLGCAGLLASAALLLCLIGVFVMKRLNILAAVAAGLLLTGCAAGGKQVLTNLQGCERHYNGVVAGGLTGGSFSGSVKIDCPSDKPTP